MKQQEVTKMNQKNETKIILDQQCLWGWQVGWRVSTKIRPVKISDNVIFVSGSLDYGQSEPVFCINVRV